MSYRKIKNFIKALALGLIMVTCFTTLAPCVSAIADIRADAVVLNKATSTRKYSDDDPEKMAANDALLETLMPKYETLRNNIRNKVSGYDLGTATSDISTLVKDEDKWIMENWTDPKVELRADHPRILVTKETIPTIRKALEEDTPTNQRFFALLDTEATNDGILGAPQTWTGRWDYPGLHNYDEKLLELIQIKALGYLVDGHELYGRQAIYYMKQFLRTLDIQYIKSCQERQYGNVAFTAALVYDWCYDLLSPDDKRQIIAGVENKTLKGYCGDPDYFSSETHKRKMTVDFPPAEYNAIAGSGAEREILRDFLAPAIAFYGDGAGENSSWWNYAAKLIYSDLVPVRNYYFKSGISHQGTGVYIYGRHLADLYSAWILETATADGKHPYEGSGIENTIRSFIGYQCAPGEIFSDGDGTYSTKDVTKLRAMSYISAYLFADSTLLAQARDMYPSTAFKNDSIELTSAMYVALTGMSDIKPAEDKYEGMSLIQYNGSPVGQYIVHQAWDDPNSANVFMKIKERNAGGHDHLDSGTFMIYYKGMLTADGGVYNKSTSDHTKYYHQATVSHNGLLIFDPSKQDSNSSDKTVKYYSGGQKKPSVLEDRYEDLLSNDYLMAKVIGNRHGYYDSAKTQPKYAYVGGNLTNAYDASTVDFVGRRMLTVYTGDEDVPMVFFVFDTITADSADYEKKFLLQICSENRVNHNSTNKTITTTNGDGKLVLTYLSDDVKITGVGGRGYTDGVFDDTHADSKNYSVNGIQVSTPDNYDDGKWGRIEMKSTNGQESATFLNSMYVTDKTNSASYVTKPITNVSTNIVSTGDVQGAVFNGSVAAIFANKEIGMSSDRLCYSASGDATVTKSISFTTEGNGTMSYYVDGLMGGDHKWRVTVNGQFVDYVKSEGGLITFDAPAGEVILKKDSDSLDAKRASYIAQVGEKLSNDNGEFTAESYAAYCTAYDQLIYDINAAANIPALNEFALSDRISEMNALLKEALPELRAEALTTLGDVIIFDAAKYTYESYQAYLTAYDNIVASINSATTVAELTNINVVASKAAAEGLLKEPLGDVKTDTITSIGGTASSDLQLNYNGSVSTDPVYSVDVTWTDISFVYTGGGAATWNPGTHAYDITTGTEGWSDSQGSVLVKNHSNEKVAVEVTFEQSDPANGTATLDIMGGTFILDSAVDTTYMNAPSNTATIAAGGVPAETGTIGKIKVRIDSVN